MQDDSWPGPSCDFPDSVGHICDDTGMTAADLTSITADYYSNMAALKNYTLAQGTFSWQMMWTGGDGVGNTCPSPLVRQSTCAADLQSLCAAVSPAQTRTMMYAFYPGGCQGNPANLTQFDQVGEGKGVGGRDS